jgi:virginiamycin B lyase
MKSQCLRINRILLVLMVFSSSSGIAVNLKSFDVSRSGVFMVADPEGALWYTHGAEASDGISRVDMSGIQVIVDGPGSPIQPRGIALADNGDLWITEGGAPLIRRLTKTGGWEAFPIPARAWHITKGPDGNLWFITSNQVGRLTPEGSVKMFSVASERSRLQFITPGPDGKLWIADAGADTILSMDPSGNLRRFPLADAGSPLSITTGPDGHLWFTEPFLNRIGRMSTDGQLTEYELPRPLSAPFQIVSGPEWEPLVYRIWPHWTHHASGGYQRIRALHPLRQSMGSELRARWESLVYRLMGS